MVKEDAPDHPLLIWKLQSSFRTWLMTLCASFCEDVYPTCLFAFIFQSAPTNNEIMALLLEHRNVPCTKCFMLSSVNLYNNTVEVSKPVCRWGNWGLRTLSALLTGSHINRHRIIRIWPWVVLSDSSACWPVSTRSSLGNKTKVLICRVWQFLWCKYSHHNRFQSHQSALASQ